VSEYQSIQELIFDSSKLEKKIRNRVLVCQDLTKKSWLESLLIPDPEDGCLNDLEVRYVNPSVGFGVFCSKDITRYSFVGEYLGFVRRRKLSFLSESDYVFGYNIRTKATSWVIDAEKMGNSTRFINHSYEPNLICSSWIKDGLSHVGFFAKRRILAHEQLTFDYGPSFWKKRPYPQTL
jgi:SET domain-containing protein